MGLLQIFYRFFHHDKLRDAVPRDRIVNTVSTHLFRQ